MATLQERLDEAEAAYHSLMTGQSVVSVRDQNGESVTYSQVNAVKLSSYIAELKRQLGLNTCSGPMGVIF